VEVIVVTEGWLIGESQVWKLANDRGDGNLNFKSSQWGSEAVMNPAAETNVRIRLAI
jgi:hypothetical protein